MAGQQDTCWRCGVEWATEQTPPTTLRPIPATAPIQAGDVPDHRTTVLVAGRKRALTDVQLAGERWTNEGGSFLSEAALPRRAAVRR
jgi:hypothetical protein